MKNKLFAFINILGLGIALACCIVAYLNWDYNVKFDTQHLNAERIYRINFIRITNGQPIKNGDCPMPLGAAINGSISQVDEVMRYQPINGNFKVGEELFRTWVSAVDPNFFDIFTFDLITGSKGELKDKSRIFISNEIADKYFPDTDDPVGELITYINRNERMEFIVGGVFRKQPLNSSFFSDAYVNYENVFDVTGWDKNDWSQFNTTFITVNNKKDIPEIERQLQQYIEIQNKAKEDYKVEKYYLDPFVGMAIRAEREDTWNHWFNNSLPVAAATAPGIMAILILLIACFNFTNTSIAIANRRIKEIGIRKVMGSSRKQLILQFLGENILLTFFALVVGILIAMLLVPAYSAMWSFLDIRLDLGENVELLVFLIFLLIATGIIAGSYPAFYVSSFQPSSILKGTLRFGGTNSFTRILLTLQYAISLMAIISGFVFAENAEYQRKYDMGFDIESVIFADVGNENRYEQLRNEIIANPLINEIAGSSDCVSYSWYGDPIKFEASELDVSILDIGDNYLNTIDATILEGRDFIKDSQNDVENSVIINQELARILGWKDPVGKRIILKDTIELYIVGLVKDIYIDGELWDPLEPMLMRYTLPKNYRFLTVKTNLQNIGKVYEFMEDKWKSLFPDELSTVRYMDETRADSAEVNNNIKIIFVFLGIVATILSVIGLFSLVSLNIIKKMKEIGVRKVLGASILNIVNNISREFVIIFGIASIIGSIAAYYMAGMMMASIWTYYVPIGALAFFLSIVLLLIVSGLTIGGKVIRAASINPAYTLRDE